MDDRPVIRCLVSYPVGRIFTAPVLCSLTLAVELQEKGWMVLVDPKDEVDLATWERLRRVPKGKKWYERD